MAGMYSLQLVLYVESGIVQHVNGYFLNNLFKKINIWQLYILITFLYSNLSKIINLFSNLLK